MCSAALWPLDTFLSNQPVIHGLEWIITEGCEKLEVYGGVAAVCKGAIDIMALSVMPVITGGILSPQRICDEHFGFCNSPHITELSAEDYVSKRVSAKPENIKNNQFVNDLYKKIAADPNPRPMRRSIQISDLHIDFKY